MLLKSNIKSIYKQEARGWIITQILEFKSGQMHINGIKLKVQFKKQNKQTSAVSVIDPTKLNSHTHKKKEMKKRLS